MKRAQPLSLANVGFTYDLRLYDQHGRLVDRDLVKNLVPTEGLNHFAGVIFDNAAQVSQWYIGLYKGNYTPLPNATAATIAAASTEATEYTASTRVAFQPGAVVAGAVDNEAALAEFTFNAPITLRGGFIVSAQPKAATSGVLGSLVEFSSPRPVDAGFTLRIHAGVAFVSA